MMSLEDNEKPGCGEAAVRVPTCKAKWQDWGQLGWRKTRKTEREQRSVLKGNIYTQLLNIYPDTDVISMKSAALLAVEEHETEWLGKKVEGSWESRGNVLGWKYILILKYWQNFNKMKPIWGLKLKGSMCANLTWQPGMVCIWIWSLGSLVSSFRHPVSKY